MERIWRSVPDARDGQIADLQAEVERLREICDDLYSDKERWYHMCELHTTNLRLLKALLAEARDVIRDEVEDNYPWKDKYPSHMRRYAMDMDIVRRIDAALAKKETNHG